MSNNSPHFFSSKSPDFTSDSKDHTPTGGEDFKGSEAEKKREVEKGREAEKRSEAIKDNEIKEGYKVKKGSEAEKEREVKKGRETDRSSLRQGTSSDACRVPELQREVGYPSGRQKDGQRIC